MQYKSTLGSK